MVRINTRIIHPVMGLQMLNKDDPVIVKKKSCDRKCHLVIGRR